MSHFKLTEETKISFGVTLFRVELTIDCKWGKAGDKGGWVKSNDNIKGDAWIYGGEIYGGVIWGGEIRGGEIWGGEIWGGEIRGGVIRGGEIWGGEIRGGEIRGGVIKKSPLQIQGSKAFFNISNTNYISIGCQYFTFEYWKENYVSIGKNHSYSDEEIAEYGAYIDLAIKLYSNGN